MYAHTLDTVIVPFCTAAFALAGCSSTHASPPANTVVTSPAPGSSATLSAPTSPPTVPASPTTPNAESVRMIAPGSYLTVIGSGCVAGSSVTVLATASHATGSTIGQGTASATGRFSLRVKVHFRGEPQATIVAICLGTDQNTIIAAEITVEYTSA